jgi:hypothetical protein
VAGEYRLALVRPRGTSILEPVEAGAEWAQDANGRVDIESGHARAILLRIDDPQSVRWVSFSSGTRRALDEKAFLELLVRVTELNAKEPCAGAASFPVKGVDG